MLDYNSKKFLVNPWPVYSYLRQHEPIHWSDKNRSFYVMKHKQIKEVLLNASFSVEHPFRTTRYLFGSTLIDLEGNRHKHLRKVIGDNFKHSNVELYSKSIIEPIVKELLEELIEKKEVDFIEDFANQVPVRIILSILGLPIKDSKWFYKKLKPIIAQIDYPDKNELLNAKKACNDLVEYISTCVKDNNIQNQDSVIYKLLKNCDEGLISKEEIIKNVLLLLPAGTETTAASIGNVFNCLLLHPNYFKKIHDEPNIIKSIVRESLRWEPPLHTSLRIAIKDTNIGSVKIKKGSFVHLCLGSANRDEEIYQEPNVWKPERKESNSLSFSLGRHGCLGSNLAIKELEIVFSLLFQCIDKIELIDSELPKITGRTFRSVPKLNIRVEPKKQAILN